MSLASGHIAGMDLILSRIPDHPRRAFRHRPLYPHRLRLRHPAHTGRFGPRGFNSERDQGRSQPEPRSSLCEPPRSGGPPRLGALRQVSRIAGAGVTQTRRLAPTRWRLCLPLHATARGLTATLVAAVALATVPAVSLAHAASAPSFAVIVASPVATAAGGGSKTPPLRTGNVILITADGLRIQELFAGMDATITKKEKHSGIHYPQYLQRARSLYWRDTPEERRRALMPFFWSTLAPQGVVLGNKDRGSRVLVTNKQLFSAPGYAEILTGRPRPEITSNALVRYPHRTALDFVQQKLGLGWTEVASIGSWEGFNYLASSKKDGFFTNGGYQRVPTGLATPRMEVLADVQAQIMTVWPESRSDAVTFGIALEYLKKHRPRLLYLALGEPDDWAHARRYDRYLNSVHLFDSYLEQLWNFLESSDFYRGKTTLILTTDHGRGVRPADWVKHGEGVRGSEDIWVAVVGPDTDRLGELAPSPTVHQADIAATLIRFFGLDDREFDPEAGPPIPVAFKSRTSSNP